MPSRRVKDIEPLPRLVPVAEAITSPLVECVFVTIGLSLRVAKAAEL